MSSTTTTTDTSLLHPLDMPEISSSNSSRRTSISSIHEEEWSQLLSQFDAHPDILILIQQCKKEEDNRRHEETKMKLKEYQLYCELQKNL